MTHEFDRLLEKLNAFIRKYYLNQLIKGSLISLTLILVLFLFVDFIEYFAWMSKTARQIVFFSFLLTAVLILVFRVVIPLLKLIKIGKTLSYEEAAKIVGRHFPEVSDKLLNVLQLKFKEKSFTQDELELLNASIAQKSMELKPVPFAKAVNLKRNIRYLKYLIPLLLFVLVFLWVYPSFILEPSKRIIHYEKHFNKPLPYSIQLKNKSLQILQHDDFVVRAQVDGEEIPSEIFVVSKGIRYRMYPVKKGLYEYTFKDVNAGFDFTLTTEDFRSEVYHLKVIPKPVIYSFDVKLSYPGYLHKKADQISGLGDLVVPEGTLIEWRIHTKDVSQVIFIKDTLVELAKKVNANTFVEKLTAMESFRYGMYAVNEQQIGQDTLFYSVQVIKDEYPEITVERYTNPQFLGFVQFNGKIKDDYGFHSLTLYYKENRENEPWKTVSLKIDPSVNEQFFSYSMQLTGLLGDESAGLNYYFEVRDNDAIHHFKSSRTSIDFLQLPGRDVMNQMKDSISDQLKEDLKRKIKELEELNKGLDQMKLDLFEKKRMEWNDKQKIAEIIKKEQDIQKKLEEIKKLDEQIRDLESSLQEKMDPSLKEKMDELRKMFDEMKNDEDFRKQLEKMKEELDNMDKDKLDKFLEKMKKENEELKENLEQNLELYKQMEVEKKVNELVNELQELAKKQEELARKTKQKKIDAKTSKEEQKKLEQKLEELDKKMDKLEKLDKELKEPFEIQKDSASMNEIKNEMEEAREKLEENKRKKASENQQKAADQMKKMAEDMKNMMSMAMMQRAGEDMDMIRRLLDNVVDLSFRQEELMKKIGRLSAKDPQSVSAKEEINDLKEEFKIIRDSLKAVGERQMFIKPFIIKETESIESDLTAAINDMANRKKGSSLSHQQYAMTHMNNLALMLDESLEQMKNSLSMNGKGGKSCPNPGQGKSNSLDEIMQQQKKLSEGLKKGEKKGKKPQKGNQKGGQDEGEWGNSEQLAKMAAMQYEIRQQLQQYLDELKAQGIGDKDLNQALEEMKKNEEDIINKKITRETINRQKDIEVRLLKAKNAKMQREKEKKRESKEGKNNVNRTVKEQEFLFKRKNEQDIIFTKPVELKYYYNKVYKKYMYKIELTH